MLTREAGSAPNVVEQFFLKNDIGSHVVDTISAAVVVIDAHGTIRMWNRAATKLTATPAEAMIGRKIVEVFPTHRGTTRELWQHLLRHRRVNRSELEIELPNGKLLSLGFSISLLAADDGTPTGAVMIARGLNEQKQYEKLMQSLDKSSRDAALSRTLDEVFDTMAAALRGLQLWTLVLMVEEDSHELHVRHVNISHMVQDMDGGPVMTDDHLQGSVANFGIPVNSALAFKHVLDVGHAYYYDNLLPPTLVTFPPALQDLFEYIAHDLGLRDGVIAPLRKDGHIVGEVIVGGYIQPEDVAPLGAYANQLSSALASAELWMSLEDRVASRTATLQAEQERLQAILNNMTDAVVFTGSDGNIEFVNPAWERLHGLSLKEVEGKPVNVLVALPKYVKLAEGVATAVTAGQMWQGELINSRADGAEYYGELTLVPVHDDSNVLRYFVGVERDITHEKAVIQAKDRFVADMSHELRTPLTNIKFYLSLLERGKPERYEQYMATLKRESNRLHNLIEDLLAISRLDQGHAAFNLEPVHLNDFLSRHIADRRQLALESGLTLNFMPRVDLPPVAADPSHLEQLAGNLLTNAIVYTPKGGSITVRSLYGDAVAGSSVGLCVHDTGLGISEEELDSVFERFFRGSASRKTNSPGTGLGLSIAQEIVHRLGGVIEAESSPEKGTTFTVWLSIWHAADSDDLRT